VRCTALGRKCAEESFEMVHDRSIKGKSKQIGGEKREEITKGMTPVMEDPYSRLVIASQNELIRECDATVSLSEHGTGERQTIEKLAKTRKTREKRDSKAASTARGMQCGECSNKKTSWGE